MLSTLSILKIVDHAIRAKDKEICGYMTGFINDGVFYVLDSWELPFEVADPRDEISSILSNEFYQYNRKLDETGNFVT